MRNESHFFLSLYQRSHVNRGSIVSTLASPLLKADSSFLISRASLLPSLEARVSQIRDDHSWDDPRREVNLGLEVVENQSVEESNVSRVFTKWNNEEKRIRFQKIALDINNYLFIIVMSRIFDDSSGFEVIWIDLYFFLSFFFCGT